MKRNSANVPPCKTPTTMSKKSVLPLNELTIPFVGWLFYGISTLSGSFNTKSNFKEFSLE